MVSPEQLEQRLGDLRPLLEVVGAFVVSESQRAFDTQQWDGDPWPHRYPFQSDRSNFVNVAALVQHLNDGGGVLSRFFDEKPALLGTGALRSSIASRIVDESRIEVGSVLDYAPIQNEGGRSTMPITPTAKSKIAKLLGKRPELEGKLGKLLELDELETDVIGRRFIGVTLQLERDIAAEVKEHLER